jgi:hypothetical protein
LGWEAPRHRTGSAAITRASSAALVALSYSVLKVRATGIAGHFGTFRDIAVHEQLGRGEKPESADDPPEIASFFRYAAKELEMSRTNCVTPDT